MTATERDAPVRVLLVEDTMEDGWLLKRAFDGSGEPVDLRIEASAEMALELLHAGVWRPDIVVIDERLPGMSGSRLAAQVSADPHFGHLLIFRYTAYPLEVAAAAPVVRKPPSQDEARLVAQAGLAARLLAVLPSQALAEILHTFATDAGGAHALGGAR